MPAAPAGTEAFQRASRRYLIAAVLGPLFLPMSLLLASPAWNATRVLLVGITFLGGALLGWMPIRRLNERFGPRHALNAYVLAWTLFLVVPVLVVVIRLPEDVLFVVAGFMGAGMSAVAASHTQLRRHFEASRDAPRFVLVGAGTFGVLLASQFVWDTSAIAYGILTVVMASSLRPLARVPDPVRPGPSPFGAFLPWRSITNERMPIGPSWWARFPAHLAYTSGTIVLFALWIIVFERDRTQVPDALTWSFVYQVPNLFADVPRTFVNFATGIWFNHHPVQIVYVFVLLGLFGVWFEIHEGSRRAIAVFYGASIFAGITAGLLLHVLHASFDAAWIERAWTHEWNGGSAGAFGLAGGYAARARKPWLLMTVLLVWEVNVELWHLRSYTVAFHVAALAFGYCWVRYWMPTRRTHERLATPSRA